MSDSTAQTVVNPADCRTPRSTWGSCIQALALGWINAPDLCPTCTQTFMGALGAKVSNLEWHQAYRDRAAGKDAS